MSCSHDQPQSNERYERKRQPGQNRGDTPEAKQREVRRSRRCNWSAKAELIPQHSDGDLIQPRFIEAIFIQVCFGTASAQERMKHSPRRDEESGSESTKIQKPGCMIPTAAARNFPCGNLSFAWPIRTGLGCDVMEIVQTRCRHARRPVGKIKRDRLGLDADPAIAIAAVPPQFGVSKKQSPGGAQRKMVRILSHRSGELTPACPN
jgi:hypothetical protein